MKIENYKLKIASNTRRPTLFTACRSLQRSRGGLCEGQGDESVAGFMVVAGGTQVGSSGLERVADLLGRPAGVLAPAQGGQRGGLGSCCRGAREGPIAPQAGKRHRRHEIGFRLRGIGATGAVA